jgi:outer membrane murein-binding lipoprotein Lpp
MIMSHVNPEAVQQAREELTKVSSLVLTARRLLAGGALVDLAAIEERVRAVCLSIETMPREDGQALCAEVQALAAKLDKLEEDLKDHVERTRPSDDHSGHGG